MQLLFERPLYGINEAGLHWYRIYHTHYREKLSLSPAIHDPCFLYISLRMSPDFSNRSLPRGFTCLQTDDMASAGNESFFSRASKMASRFVVRFHCKPTKVLENVGSITFKGVLISIDIGNYSIAQPRYMPQLKLRSETDAD